MGYCVCSTYPLISHRLARMYIILPLGGAGEADGEEMECLPSSLTVCLAPTTDWKHIYSSGG